jgi:hypothetical protein
LRVELHDEGRVVDRVGAAARIDLLVVDAQ